MSCNECKKGILVKGNFTMVCDRCGIETDQRNYGIDYKQINFSSKIVYKTNKKTKENIIKLLFKEEMIRKNTIIFKKMPYVKKINIIKVINSFFFIQSKNLNNDLVEIFKYEISLFHLDKEIIRLFNKSYMKKVIEIGKKYRISKKRIYRINYYWIELKYRILEEKPAIIWEKDLIDKIIYYTLEVQKEIISTYQNLNFKKSSWIVFKLLEKLDRNYNINKFWYFLHIQKNFKTIEYKNNYKNIWENLKIVKLINIDEKELKN